MRQETSLTVELRQRLKVVLESLSEQLICEEPPHGDGDFALCIGLTQGDRANCVKITPKGF